MVEVPRTHIQKESVKTFLRLYTDFLGYFLFMFNNKIKDNQISNYVKFVLLE